VGSGKPGPLWQKVSAAFAQLRERLATTRAP